MTTLPSLSFIAVPSPRVGDVVPFLAHAREVVSDGHVEGDGEVGVHVDTQRGGTAKADFLLYRGTEMNRRVRVLDSFCRLQHGEEADSVVERLPGDVLADLHRRLLHGDDVADGDALVRLVCRKTEVDVNVLDVLFPFVAVEQVRRDRPDDAPEVFFLGVDDDALCPQYAGVPSAEGVERDESVVVHVPNHEPDLVHVGCNGDVVVRCPLYRPDDVPHRVGVEVVHFALQLPPNDVADSVLVSRRTVRFGQFT